MAGAEAAGVGAEEAEEAGAGAGAGAARGGGAGQRAGERPALSAAVRTTSAYCLPRHPHAVSTLVS